MASTSHKDYTDRSLRESLKKWKLAFDVQAPYRWNLKRLNLGTTLDIGCGIGRHLRNLDRASVGVDHNPTSIQHCKEQGLTAFTAEDFHNLFKAKGVFDSLLFSHVVEHMRYSEAAALLGSYQEYLKPEGKVIIIAPQDCGYRSDYTHVEYFDFQKIERLLLEVGFKVQRAYSFPFPELFGHFFKHNEFCVVGVRK